MAKGKIRSRVILIAADANGNLVEEIDIPFEAYYDDGVSVVDSEDYRTAKGIRKLSGKIYDSKGNLQQSFENEYSTDGALAKSRAVHADGTVTELPGRKPGP